MSAQDRKWRVDRELLQDEDGAYLEPEDSFRTRVMRKFSDVEATGHMIGGAFYSRPVREEVEPGVWETTGWHIMWIGEAAARRATGEFDRKPEPEPEPEPALVGADEEGDD